MNMDGNSSIVHERLYDDERQSGRRKVSSYTPRTEWIPFGLLALLFVLILTLFIIVFHKANENKKQLITLKEMDDFRGKVHKLYMDMDQLHTSLKKKTCEVGWKQFEESCYFLTVTRTSWSKTRSLCLKKEADLASVTSEREQIFLKTYSDASSSKRFWIGLHDMDEEGSWIWVDGTDYETSYKSWKKGEPNDMLGDEDCAHLWSFGEWNDVPCTYEDAYGICEKKL
ncbi:hepatic lectin-like [Hyla sarda]|uniref:hepatic lectin-like n=1 Tax=Hyla sarda TaxID=327740 RepID=UPI0024C222B3|nr:hepatic lectin-like [Hyla sarda]XP_056425116.1 hepatic lectin-like [Hyla sarda]